jgi:hypothetical protein
VGKIAAVVCESPLLSGRFCPPYRSHLAGEEAYLTRKLGAVYLDCMSRVRRWI